MCLRLDEVCEDVSQKRVDGGRVRVGSWGEDLSTLRV